MAGPCVIDTDCISLSVTVDDELQADPILATTNTGFPANCNGLECTTDGLWAPPFGPAEREYDSQVPFTSGNPVVNAEESPILTVRWTNPSDCYEYLISVQRQHAIQAISSADGAVNAIWQVGFSISYGSPAPAPVYLGEALSLNWVPGLGGYQQVGVMGEPNQGNVPNVPAGSFVECKSRIRVFQLLSAGPTLTYGPTLNHGMAIFGWPTLP